VSDIIEYGCRIGMIKIIKIGFGYIHFITTVISNTDTDIHIDVMFKWIRIDISDIHVPIPIRKWTVQAIDRL
jgi:hypothetical protein